MRQTLRCALPVLLVLLLPALALAANPTFDIKTVSAAGVSAPLRFRPGTTPFQTADFNKDGIADLVSLTSGGVAVFFNDGQANFTRVDLAVVAPGSLQLADFDNDGRVDIAVASMTATSNHPIILFLNNGDKTFHTVNVTSPQWSGFSFATADINGDGRADIVLAFNSKTVSVMLGNGDGTFQSPKDVYTVTPSPRAADPSIYGLQGIFIAG